MAKVVKDKRGDIMISQEELWAFNTLINSVRVDNEELQRAIAARDSYIKLLEEKYHATFDTTTGQFVPQVKTEE